MTIPTDTDSHQRAGGSTVLHIKIMAGGTRIEMTAGTHTDVIRQFLPVRQHVTYLLVAQDGEALYVGQTGTPRQRLRRHCLTKDWWPQVAGITLRHVDGEFAGRVLERELTDSLQPRYSQVAEIERRRLDWMLANHPDGTW